MEMYIIAHIGNPNLCYMCPTFDFLKEKLAQPLHKKNIFSQNSHKT